MKQNRTQIINDFGCLTGESLRCEECMYRSIPYPSCKSLNAAKALDLINELIEELDKYKVVNKLLELDLADRNSMLEKKVEEVYADFMRDYKLMCEELEGAYEELAEVRKERDELQDTLLRSIKQYLHGILDEWYRRQEEPHFYGQNIMVYNHVRKELDDLYTFAEKLGVNLDKESQ